MKRWKLESYLWTAFWVVLFFILIGLVIGYLQTLLLMAVMATLVWLVGKVIEYISEKFGEK